MARALLVRPSQVDPEQFLDVLGRAGLQVNLVESLEEVAQELPRPPDVDVVFLESARVLSPVLREVILERAMALPEEVVGLEKLKVIALLVLWARKGSVDALILDELLPDGEKRQMH